MRPELFSHIQIKRIFMSANLQSQALFFVDLKCHFAALNMLQRLHESLFHPLQMVIWQWELGQLCLLPGYMNFTHAPVTLVYTCRAVLTCFLFCFEHRQKSLKSLVKSNVTSRLCCTKSTEEEEEDVGGGAVQWMARAIHYTSANLLH